MKKIKLSEVTIKKIESRELKKLIPELYELEEIIENNISHNNDSVFSHTIFVLAELEKLFERIDEKAKNYLEGKVDFNSRREILFFSAVFHDIGKKETFKREKDTVTCPGHKQMGSKKIQNILPRFLLSDKEKEIITQIIGHHGFFHNLLDGAGDDFDKKAGKFIKDNLNIFLEVTLLTIADIFGSQLKKNDPKRAIAKIDFLEKIINNY